MKKIKQLIEKINGKGLFYYILNRVKKM